ncbi:hypothetical protein NKG94_23860 [Micromonospora sp. M12]
MPHLTQPAPEPERRATVDATRRTVAASQVTEEQPYRFDRGGNLVRGVYDFSSDLISGGKGDKVAFERAQTFMRQQFELEMTAAAFDVDRADATALNPNRQRPTCTSTSASTATRCGRPSTRAPSPTRRRSCCRSSTAPRAWSTPTPRASSRPRRVHRHLADHHPDRRVRQGGDHPRGVGPGR